MKSNVGTKLIIASLIVAISSVVALPVASQVEHPQLLSELPQGVAPPCTDSDTFDLLNFCDSDFRSGDIAVCFKDTFAESLPPGDTYLQLLSGSSNFEIVDVRGGNDYFKLTIRATTDAQRHFSGVFELTFKSDCAGGPIGFEDLCTSHLIYDWWSGTPLPEMDPEWTLSVLTNGEESLQESLLLTNPSIMSVAFDISYGTNYDREPTFVMEFWFDRCEPHVARFDFSNPQLLRPAEQQLPNTGSSSGLLTLAFILTVVGTTTLGLRRHSSASSVRLGQ